MAKGKKTGGRDWVPGVCPNPKGRPVVSPEVIQARKMTPERFNRIMDEQVTDEYLMSGVRKSFEMWEKTGNPTWIMPFLDRWLGKPKEQIDITGMIGAMTREQLIAEAEKLILEIRAKQLTSGS